MTVNLTELVAPRLAVVEHARSSGDPKNHLQLPSFMTPKGKLQSEYYSRTASQYDAMHFRVDEEHNLACYLMTALTEYLQIYSLLDVGSGTGRALTHLSRARPQVRAMGIEPVEAMRKVGYSHGIPQNCLVDGDATSLAFQDASFDMVIALGVLHHIPRPRLAIAEMLRVAKRAVFISDSNRFGQGHAVERYSKWLLWKVGLWPIANWIKTRGKGYHYEAIDGVSYSYSIFDDYDFIEERSAQVMVFNLKGCGKCPVIEAPNIGLLAVKGPTQK